jgi:hypothetical protein
MLTTLAALNWPHHRGTATAFPLAAFGLSAFFYTLLSGLAFPGKTSSLLLLLSIGTSCLVLVCIPFLHIVGHNARYSVLPTNEDSSGLPTRDSNQLHRTKSGGSKYNGSSLPQREQGRHYISFEKSLPLPKAATNYIISRQ